MTLRQKTLLVTGVVLAVVIVLLYVVLRVILDNAYAALEAQDAQENVQRALNALDDEIAAFSNTTWDYARWDDSVAFVQSPNPDSDYIVDNYTSETFGSHRINLAVYADPSGEIVYSTGYDLETDSLLPVPQSVQDYLTTHPDLLRHDSAESSTTGIVKLPEGVMIVASRPVVNSEGTDPVEGALLWGRWLTEAEIQSLADSARLDLRLTRTDDSATLSEAVANAMTVLRAENAPTTLVTPLDEQRVAGYALVNDLDGTPALLVDVELPRGIYQQGQNSLNSLLIAIAATGAVLILVTLIVLERFVLKPVAELSSSVSRIGGENGTTERLPVTGGDELARLGGQINHMLDRLQQTQEAIREKDMRLTAIFTGTPIALFTLDKGGTFTLAEGKGLEAMGVRPNDLLGQSIFNVYRTTPVLIEQYMKALAGTPGHLHVELNDTPMEIWQAPLKNQNDNTTGVIGVASKISQPNGR